MDSPCRRHAIWPADWEALYLCNGQNGVEIGLRLAATVDGAQGRIRTTDTRIFSPLLYQLSYLGFSMT